MDKNVAREVFTTFGALIGLAIGKRFNVPISGSIIGGGTGAVLSEIAFRPEKVKTRRKKGVFPKHKMY